ncbi:phosphoenolpyruvate carboxykinase [uncultured Ilyobacter sp.]|uniref:phosphoenolpyruvate carboxykinase n=1 Tax=uncultured Ilyobacter sp. TaxID=544433 RepID=UPI0029C66EEA|nr:phosphoenolpyruvate carboxykinase [uncultured Ilyobacter sp.]
MRKEFLLSRQSAIINFTAKYCDTREKLLDSQAFKTVLISYMEIIKNKDNAVYNYFIKRSDNDFENMVDNLIVVFKLLLVLQVEDISKIDSKYAIYFEEKEYFVELIEGIYSFWRKLERYSVVSNRRQGEGLQNVGFIEANNNFSNMILGVYRRIEETVIGYQHRVYRQLPAGANAGLIVNEVKWPAPHEYSFLERVPFIETIILEPPFIIYPKKNKREGITEEVFTSPLLEASVNEHHWFCYPAKVGTLLAYIYFHKDFMCHGVTLCNLFELAKEDEYRNKKPDIIYVYGMKDFQVEKRTCFYKDKENSIILGYANYHEDIDYFGYMKTMILTLHNIHMMEQGSLPVHGAMVNVVTKTGKESNIIIVGDSGAGKSESIEALRALSENYVKDMKVIFDDMGVLKLDCQNRIVASGTEIGAFIRMDDLDRGYAYQSMDRSIFMNPDRENSRVVLPITSYDDIVKEYPVDYIFYANNYENGEEISFFENSKDALKVFKEAKRVAKGTTSEKGLVTSYFANPFGPIQRKGRCDMLLNKYFSILFERGVKVGEVRTRLGIGGMEKEGPKKLAIKLFEIIK